jgi:hypothetical protein
MPIENKIFNGIMNYDDPNDVLPSRHHKSANNMVFRGNAGNMRAEGLNGTRLVPNALLPSGINQTIGAHHDSLGNRLIFFNYNSSGNHGIYIYNTLSGIFQTLIRVGSYTDGDILGFDPTSPITSIDIIYGDPGDGDILYYVDSLKRPTNLNITRYLNNTYTLIKRSFIDVIKAPPSMPIKCAYENDYNVTVNNLKNSLFQFIYRFVYDDNQKSVWSSGSIVPLPYEPFSQTIDNNRFYNARISLYLQTGGDNVKKIEIAMRQAGDNATSDYYLIDSLDKSALSITSSTIYRYLFYNDGLYNIVDTAEQILLFDYVPDEANSMVLLNGNVPAYAGIKEGYDLFPSLITATSPVGNTINEVNGVLFAAIQGDDDSYGTVDTLILYLSGVGDNDSNGNPTSLYNSRLTFNVQGVNTSGGRVDFSFTTSTDINSISSLFTSLRSAAVGVGFTYVSQTLNSITFSYAGYKLYGGYLFLDRSLTTLNNIYSLEYTNQYQANYDYGIAYYDKNGKTNGVITNLAANIKTITAQGALGYKLPTNILSIANRPPLWAEYFNFVVSSNLTYNTSLYWVSARTFADAQATNGNQYAYIDVSNIADYNLGYTSADGKVNSSVYYSYTPGDRIRFIKRIAVDKTETLLTAQQYDYEIVGVSNVFNGVGLTQEGTFLKIKYPTADISSDFGFGVDSYNNYEIFIYNYAKHQSSTDIAYYEIGKRRKVGNPFTSNAYHICKDQVQSATSPSGTPGIETIVGGDFFGRYRNVPCGIKYEFDAPAHGFDTYSIVQITVPTTITNSSYTLTSQPYSVAYTADGSYPSYANTDCIYKSNVSVVTQVRFKGSLSIKNDVQGFNFSMYAIVCANTSPFANKTNIKFYQHNGVPQSTVFNFDIDYTVSVPPNGKVWLAINNESAVGFNAINYYDFNIEVQVVNNIQIFAIENTATDAYQIRLNSYSRPLIEDVNAKREYKSTLLRYGNPKQEGTNINNTNRFYPNNYDEFDRKFGSVVRMVSRQKNVRIFQERRCGTIGVYSKFIKNNSGASELIVSDTILSSNNIQYYDGDFGIGNQAASLTSSSFVDYFVDPVMGYILRLSNDGITPISQLYKMQTFAGNQIPKYLNNVAYTGGGYAKVLGAFHFSKDKEGEYISVYQGSTDASILPYTLAFNEQKNAFTSFYKFVPDWIINFNNTLATFKGGNLYIHDSTTYNNFYGTQYNSDITFVFNEKNVVKKDFNFLTIESSAQYTLPSITTSLGQVSNLVAGDFEIQEGLYHGALLKDSNSIGGIINGDYLKGTWIETKLQQDSPSNLVYLSGLYLGYQVSPRNF